MPTAAAEIPVGFTRDPCLGVGNWLDDKLGFFDEIVKAAASDRVAGAHTLASLVVPLRRCRL